MELFLPIATPVLLLPVRFLSLLPSIFAGSIGQLSFTRNDGLVVRGTCTCITSTASLLPVALDVLLASAWKRVLGYVNRVRALILLLTV